MNDEVDIQPWYLHQLWSQLMSLTGINVINANLTQPINHQEDLKVFHTILTALGRAVTDLDIFHNWFSSGTAVDHGPPKTNGMTIMPPTWTIYPIPQLFPNDIRHAFSITAGEWEAWCHDNAPGHFLTTHYFFDPGKHSLLLLILLLPLL